MNNLAFTVRIVHVCVEIQSAVKPRNATLILVSRRNTQRFLPLPYRLPYPQKYLFIVRAETNLFLLILFSKIEFYIFFS